MWTRPILTEESSHININPVYTITFWALHSKYFGSGAAFFRHCTANSDSVNCLKASAPFSGVIVVPSTTKYVGFGTPIIAVPCRLLLKCKYSAVLCRGKNQCAPVKMAPDGNTRVRSGANF